MITLEMFNEMISEEIEEIKDGKRHGKFNSYYVNGSRKGEVYTTGQYENGKKVGRWIIGTNKFVNGEWIIGTSDIEDYKDGKRHGVQFNYYQDGWIRSEVTYENGSLTGPCKWFYPKGKEELKIKETGQFKDGKKVGEWLQYDDKGLIERITKYDRGEVIENYSVPARWREFWLKLQVAISKVEEKQQNEKIKN